ncbi:MAG: SRPBCC family protein [Solirubrobacteraceae bacterium]
MDPVSVSIVVSAPREQVFDFLQDIANHRSFTDHYLLDWHLTRIDSVGRGAGARFRLKARGPGSRFGWGDVVFAEVERPHRIVELGRGGKNNRVRTLGVYELEPAAAGSTRVTFTFESAPATLPDRLTELLGARGWLRRKNARALRRLRDLLEQPPHAETAPEREARVTVAGG